jgi:MFS family permease
MVVELSKGSEVGRYTGFYYTASMAAQTLTPLVSGLLMDKISMTTLFPYGCVFVLLAVVTMLFVKHGDNRPIPVSRLETLGGD